MTSGRKVKYRPGIALEETGGGVGIEVAGRDLDNGAKLVKLIKLINNITQ